MELGIGQTFDTCWFYSALNIFLLSDNGFKIMWKKMREFYASLNQNSRNHFNAPFNLPCPYGNAALKNKMYFWKFIDQYMCAIGGPGGLKTIASNTTAPLLEPFPFRNPGTREAKGLAPGFPQLEIFPILKHIGFKSGEEFSLESWGDLPNASWKYPFLVYKWRINRPYNVFKVLNINKNAGNYELTGASIRFRQRGRRVGHVISGFVQGGKQYIFDSAKPFAMTRCNWSNQTRLKEFMKNNYGTVYGLSFAYIVYTYKPYTDRIAPFCRRKYKPLSAINEETGRVADQASRNLGIPSWSVKANQERAPFMTPAVRVALKRNWALQNRLTANSFRGVLNSATSYKNGMNAVRGLVKAGYTYNANGNNWRNFKKNLLAKFPNPAPQWVYKAVLKKGNYEKLNRQGYFKLLNNSSINSGYTINKNNQNYRNFVATVNQRTKTRAGAKRQRNLNN